MTAVDMYDKFIKSGRKRVECVFSWKKSLQSVRTSLYRMRKQRDETFQIKTDDLTLIIQESPNDFEVYPNDLMDRQDDADLKTADLADLFGYELK